MGRPRVCQLKARWKPVFFLAEEKTSTVPFFVFGLKVMAFTFFFRDEQTLKVLLEHALPVMQGQAFIRIWDAGCAHGPEPYTLAILLRERMTEMHFRNVRIHATDMDPQFASHVASGIFPEEELRRVPADLFERYFRPADSPARFQVVDELRSRIEFTRHDLLSLVPVREDLSLIVCKNVLLHFEERQRCDVLRMFHGALRKDGLLVMEHTQKVPEALRPLLEQVATHAQVYRKIDVPAANGRRLDSGAADRVGLLGSRSLPYRSSPSQVLSGG
jgi:chemotaxis protein methyltransferase CheR